MQGYWSGLGREWFWFWVVVVLVVGWVWGWISEVGRGVCLWGRGRGRFRNGLKGEEGEEGFGEGMGLGEEV